MKKTIPAVLILISLIQCNSTPEQAAQQMNVAAKSPEKIKYTDFDTATKSIHVFVALCDNKWQGIVPVPARIGNGQDPNNNLYWGCSAGIRTYFKKSKSWKLLRSYKIDSIKLERLIFKNNSTNYYLVADAYNGKYIKNCTIDFLESCSGQMKDTTKFKDRSIGIYGNSKLVAYIGHDGLMDFNLTDDYSNVDNIKRDAIILACISKKYFNRHLGATKAYPIVWTTGLMCPEAYTLHDALMSYINNESKENIRTAAATAYSRFQKCSLTAAKNLLVSGW